MNVGTIIFGWGLEACQLLLLFARERGGGQGRRRHCEKVDIP